MASSRTRCRVCLIAYTAFMVVLTAIYLCSQWDLHRLLFDGHAEAESATDEIMGTTAIAFEDSGVAECIVVLLFHIFHLVCLGLLLLGNKSNLRMAIGCTLLVTCGLVYVLFYGAVLLQRRLEQPGTSLLHSTDSAAAGRQQEAVSIPYRLNADYSDDAIAAAGAAASIGRGAPHGAEAADDAAHIRKNVGDAGTCRAARSSEGLSFGELVWTVLETLVDVFTTITVSSATETESGGMPYPPDGLPVASSALFTSVHHLWLVFLNGVGIALGVWGLRKFDLDADASSVASKAHNPALTAAALAQLAARGSRGNLLLIDPHSSGRQGEPATFDAKKRQ